MRAICESCEGRQPVDWSPGDLCVHCGAAARAEFRCFWCAKWGPKGKFCRACGAIAVAPEHYGCARMLKHHGASMFEIPKLLAEFDPDLIATHTSIYGTHAALANRHVEDVRWLGQFLYLPHWAEELEDQLVPQLPFDEARFKELSAGHDARYDARKLSRKSPIHHIRELAQLARLRQGDFEDLRESRILISSGDERIAAEAALQFTGWRALFTTYTEIPRYELVALLQRSPLPALAAPRLAALGEQVPYELTGEPDTDFLVHALRGNLQDIEAKLDSPDPQVRYGAAVQLIRHRATDRIGSTLEKADEPQQIQLLSDIARLKAPATALHPALFRLVENAGPRVRRSAARVLTIARDPADCLRLLDLGMDDHDIKQCLLRSGVDPETYREMGRRMVSEEKLSAEQWGWDEALKPGNMPVDFIPEIYGHASDAMRIHLLRLAEKQIEIHGKERTELERFLIRQCLADAPADVVGQAWAGMHRIQMHRQVGLTVPCDLSMENVAWCWTLPELLDGIARLLARPETVRQTFVRDDFSRFLKSADDDFFAAAAAWLPECEAVRTAVPFADPFMSVDRFANRLPR